MIANKVCKDTTLACDRRGKIAAIRDAIETSSIQIEIKLQNRYPKKLPSF